MPVYNVTMRATITKSFTVEADNEELAEVIASEEFNPLHSPDEYNDEVVSIMSCFEPIDHAEHAKGNAGHDVPDYCANCNRPFMDHHNGQCPDDLDQLKEDERSEHDHAPGGPGTA